MTKQLGRQLAIRYQVAAECEYGWPNVLRNLPVGTSGEPNPNLYYLCCPWLRRELARLEDAGFIGELQRMIAADSELSSDLRQAQSQHAQEYRTEVMACGLAEADGEFLIAGAREPLLLKCLHAHMAFYLVHPDYRLGMKIAGAIGTLSCADERCAAWMDEIRSGDSGL